MYCNALHRTATHGNTMWHTATHHAAHAGLFRGWRHLTATHCDKLCNTLQHSASHCNTPQHTATHCNTLPHTTTHHYTLHHTATHCNTPGYQGLTPPHPQDTKCPLPPRLWCARRPCTKWHPQWSPRHSSQPTFWDPAAICICKCICAYKNIYICI